MSKVLVAYFSASGVTRKVAAEIAKAEQAELFEILPEVPYSAKDLDWKDKQSRSTLEMQDTGCRPPIAGQVENMAQYDVIFIGFSVWWGREPSVIDTFLDAHDFTGKTIVPFCTSGGSGIGETAKRMQEIVGASTVVKEGTRLGGTVSEADLAIWASELDL